jgi:hypothetical protein
MRIPNGKSWVRLVFCYWVLMSLIFFLELRYMESDWAGFPGFLLTLPLSAVIVVIYLTPAFAFRVGYELPQLNLTDYQFEYAFMVCAFLNAFIFYPIYLLWLQRKQPKLFDSAPPPPNSDMHRTRD